MTPNAVAWICLESQKNVYPVQMRTNPEDLWWNSKGWIQRESGLNPLDKQIRLVQTQKKSVQIQIN